MDVNPFVLFQRQAETAELWLYRSPGMGNEKLAVIRVIVKQSNDSNRNDNYPALSTLLRFHIDVNTLPDEYAEDPPRLMNLIIKTNDSRTYRIDGVSIGADMTTGTTAFITVKTSLYARDSI